MKSNLIQTIFHMQNEYKEEQTAFEIWVFANYILELGQVDVKWVFPVLVRSPLTVSAMRWIAPGIRFN